MKIIIVNPTNIVNRITQFYRNAKLRKYNNSYGWNEVRKDINLARHDTNFLPCGFSTQEWINAGYRVVRNSRNWAFAYKIDENGDMLIFDVENCKNLTVEIDRMNDLSLQKALSSIRKPEIKISQSLGYGWWAIRHDDGFIYIHNRKGDIMPHIRFNEIVRIFRKRKDDPNIYAVGQYGGKKVKFYLNGKHIMLEDRYRKNILRLTESQFHKMLVDCINKIISEIA